jgi:hypothetical protein
MAKLIYHAFSIDLLKRGVACDIVGCTNTPSNRTVLASTDSGDIDLNMQKVSVAPNSFHNVTRNLLYSREPIVTTTSPKCDVENSY